MTLRAATAIFSTLIAVLVAGAGVASAAYQGPMSDAHSHLPNPDSAEPLIAAMARHNIQKVLLLGVGGVQKQDVEWIAAAARRHPDRIIQAAPVPDPLNPSQPQRLEALLATGKYRAAGEVHVRQVSRKIDRRPDDPAFLRVLEVAAKHGVPVVIHAELTDESAAALERALKAHAKTTVILAHGGSAEPARLEGLLARNPNLMVDLSGMHFMRKPALATESGPLDPAWKALIEKVPDRFLMGIDVWAPRLFEPATLDRLMAWTRRILGELKPDVAQQVAYTNAARLLKVR